MEKLRENIINEICTVIKDNLILLYDYEEEALINIRKYCYENENKKYKSLDYITLVYFIEEALAELINCTYLYDFREIE